MSKCELPIPVSFTAVAAEKIRDALTARKSGLGIRLFLSPSGCAGWSYAMRYVDEIECDDLQFACDGFTFFVKSKLYEHLKGVKLDYQIRELEEGFTFIHPNSSEQCSCGKSFSRSSCA